MQEPQMQKQAPKNTSYVHPAASFKHIRWTVQVKRGITKANSYNTRAKALIQQQ